MNLLERSPYESYVYAYPHKTAYRQIEPAPTLREVWANEKRESLFLYVHIPFCGMRCGFCNLFTQAKPTDSLVEVYLDVLEREAEIVKESLPDAHFSRFAMGGGTPTYLNVEQLERTLNLCDTRTIPACVEVSPETVTREKLALLDERKIDRISMGIQSFIESETANSGRPQKRNEVDASLNAIRSFPFPVLNLDLIYGLPGQTLETWLYSLKCALTWKPEELYLYPLYVRPLTGLGRSHKEWDDIRLMCYRAGRDHLLSCGYEQVSMRMFRLPHAKEPTSTVYCCQDDGMIGLGCGARSYTRSLHYSGEYAVSAKGVRAILAEYIARDATDRVHHGFILNADEQRRRFILQSLLNLEEGLSFDHYRYRFASDVLGDYPSLSELEPLGLATRHDDRMSLTACGVERSDAIGPWFYSANVQRLMTEYELR